jgi:hypothetical protein
VSATHTQIREGGAVAVLLGARRVAPGLGTDGLAPTRTKTPRAHEVERSEKTKARSPRRGYLLASPRYAHSRTYSPAAAMEPGRRLA